MISLSDISHVHMVGIGGIGLSALAKLLALKGVRVTGTDMVRRPVMDGLEDVGVEVRIGGWIAGAEGADLLVYSKAVPDDDPDREYAKQEGIPEMSYAELLGLVSKAHTTVAITGTHGKTTTTAMLAKIAVDAGLKPTVVVGSIMHDTKSNLIVGSGSHFITEACEYKRSFLTLEPTVLVITTIDRDHLDYFTDLSDIQQAFCEMTDRIVDGGALVYDPRDVNQAPVVAHLKETAGARHIRLVPVVDEPIPLEVFGDFNQHNAQCACTAAGVLGIDEETAHTALRQYPGTWRRQEKKGETLHGIVVYDDYGHAPAEVSANLHAFKEHTNGPLVVVFQPHLFSRTRLLLDEFASSFSDADHVIVLPIYAAREKDTGDISHADLARALVTAGVDARAVNSFDEAVQMAAELLPNGGVVVTQGAGDVSKVGDLLLS